MISYLVYEWTQPSSLDECSILISPAVQYTLAARLRRTTGLASIPDTEESACSKVFIKHSSKLQHIASSTIALLCWLERRHQELDTSHSLQKSISNFTINQNKNVTVYSSHQQAQHDSITGSEKLPGLGFKMYRDIPNSNLGTTCYRSCYRFWQIILSGR